MEFACVCACCIYQSLIQVNLCYPWISYRRGSLVPRPRRRREKWPGIHCLRMRKRFRKSSANESDYGQVTHGCFAEKY